MDGVLGNGIMHIDAPGLQMFLRIDQSSRDSARLAYGCLIAGDGEFRLTHPIMVPGNRKHRMIKKIIG